MKFTAHLLLDDGEQAEITFDSGEEGYLLMQHAEYEGLERGLKVVEVEAIEWEKE